MGRDGPLGHNGSPPTSPHLGGRVEDARLLRGRGKYIDDMETARGTIHAAILRSPIAHARIQRFDAAEARNVSGVMGVYSGQDLAKILDPFPNIIRSAPDYRAVATDRVRYVGEPVAVILARNRYVAEDAAALIAVDYDPLPVVVDPEEAARNGAPLLHEAHGSNVAWQRHYRYGNPERAFADADLVVRAKLRFPKYNSTPLETYGVLATYHPETDGYTINANFQGPFSLAAVMAKALRVPDHKIRIVVPEDVGGSFGNKAMVYPYMALMAACARMSGRPVKWIEDRSEHLLGSASGTDRVSEVEAAVRKDGRILAVRVSMKENVGAYLRAPEPSCVMRSLTTFSGPYDIQHGEIDVACVMTNKLPTGLNRGYGGQQHVFTLERLVDKVAQATNIDPAEVRRRNFIAATQFPHRTTTGSLYDSGDYHGCLQKLLDTAGYEELRQAQRRLREEGRLVGLGLATMIHSAASNIGYVTLALSYEERAHPK
jgi:2-furoyl-CoA dehydrogenase large subunit